jgi:hypothetical protein
MTMNKFVHVLLVFATVFITMQISTLDTAEAGKYPRIRADAGDDFKVFENKEVKLDGSESRGGFEKFVDFEWELVGLTVLKYKIIMNHSKLIMPINLGPHSCPPRSSQGKLHMNSS